MGHPPGASENVEFVNGWKGNLEQNGGNFQNATSGPLLNRTLGGALNGLSVVQLFTSMIPGLIESHITGVYEGWSFRGAVPNPNALFLSNPSKAATTLDGYSITVFGPKGATDYSVHNGNYYPADSNKPIDGNKGKGV